MSGSPRPHNVNVYVPQRGSLGTRLLLGNGNVSGQNHISAVFIGQAHFTKTGCLGLWPTQTEKEQQQSQESNSKAKGKRWWEQSRVARLSSARVWPRLKVETHLSKLSHVARLSPRESACLRKTRYLIISLCVGLNGLDVQMNKISCPFCCTGFRSEQKEGSVAAVVPASVCAQQGRCHDNRTKFRC